MVQKITLGVATLAGALGIYAIIQNNGLQKRIDALETNTKIIGKTSPKENTENNGDPNVNFNIDPSKLNKNPNGDLSTQLNTTPIENTVPTGPTTSIKFTEESHDFGKVKVKSDNVYAFSFTNTGNEPLIISNAKGSCGCTVPNWPKEPILPGKTGVIDVKFTPNEGQGGQTIEKVVTVTANTDPVNTMVKISATVEKE